MYLYGFSNVFQRGKLFPFTSVDWVVVRPCVVLAQMQLQHTTTLEIEPADESCVFLNPDGARLRWRAPT